MDIQQSFQQYLNEIEKKYSQLETSEMGYRTDMEILLKQIFSEVNNVRIHHDAKSIKGNKPDFIIYKNVPLLYIEVKDIGISLDKVEKSEQMSRYYGYANLVLTDYLEFRFYRNGERYEEPIKIADYNKVKRTLIPYYSQFDYLVKTIIDFTSSNKEPIKSGLHLAKILGGRASRIRENVIDMLKVSDPNSDLKKIYEVVRISLISDLNIEKFADMYAQTLVYGLFVARYYDKTQNDFSRSEATKLLPKSNPFLRSFFDHISGAYFPDRMKFIVDELCEIFSYSNIANLLHDTYGYEKENRDPIIHFYEDFLKEYDSQMKVELGVFYTPKEVVQFIIRSVDKILKTEFQLARGLTDISKITRKVKVRDDKGKLIKHDEQLHRVQILDIATGTGSFLNESILQIYKSFENNKGSWESYVMEELIPRLHGFELMMASYTIAHLKLGMTLGETGVSNPNKRLGIYLTNTLEEGIDNQLQGSFFGLMESIADESREASKVKNDLPIMVVIGNPPYSGESMNAQYKGNDVYKVEPGGKLKLQERNSKWINDDYVKFIRFSESLIEKNGVGLIGMITAHGYIDNPTFRGMRWHLRKTFDKIYVIDLHGNSNKKEVSPDGSKDENVFDIKTGVSIIFAIKHNNNQKNSLGKVYKYDLYGKRVTKFAFLNSSDIKTIKWNEIPEKNELWKNESEAKDEYEKGFSVKDLFIVNGVGIVTARDKLVIGNDKDVLVRNAQSYRDDDSETADELCRHHNISNKLGWNALKSREMLRKEDNLEKYIQTISYRPFDNKKIFYHHALVWRTVEKVMKNLLLSNNVCLIVRRQTPDRPSYFFLSDKIVADGYIRSDNKGGESVLPLYLLSEDGSRVPNLNNKILTKITNNVGKVSPEEVFDYIYAVLYTPNYREKYKDLLKINFPRIPYPNDKVSFLKLVDKGKKLKELHLMILPNIESLIRTSFDISGNNAVEKFTFDNGKVYINSVQYFENVSEVAWNFYIGGYQPAQKWLKDRKGMTLSYEDIEHYRKIITVLDETDKVMKELNNL